MNITDKILQFITDSVGSIANKRPRSIPFRLICEHFKEIDKAILKKEMNELVKQNKILFYRGFNDVFFYLKGEV